MSSSARASLNCTSKERQLGDVLVGEGVVELHI
jgi:hypothetical protein